MKDRDVDLGFDLMMSTPAGWAFCHMLLGRSGAIGDPRRHSKRKLCGGLSAGVTFIFPGAVVIVVPSRPRVHYG